LSGGMGENYQVCCVQYCVQQFCTVRCTHMNRLTVLWIGFCLTGPISLCLDSFLANVNTFANVNSRSRSLYAIARPSVVCLSSVCLSYVVCNVRAPYSGGSNFRQYFYGIRYLGHPLTSTENFMEMSQGNPSAGGVKHKRGSQV